jgi:predicted DNA-binding transcriptional regulator AlpA
MAQAKIENQPLPQEGYIRLSRVLEIIPLSRSTLYRKMDAGNFPKPIKLSERINAWNVVDIRAWLNQLGEAA